MKKTFLYFFTIFTVFSIGSYQVKNLVNSIENNDVYFNNKVDEGTPTFSPKTQLNISDVESGTNTSFLVLQNASGRQQLFGCGSNEYGLLLGESTDSNMHEEFIPLNYDFAFLIFGGWDIKFFTANENNAGMVVEKEGESDRIFTWGDNRNGQLGDGQINQNPVNVAMEITSQFDEYYPNGMVVDELKLSSTISGAIIEDSITHETSLFTWGYNDQFQIGVGDASNHNQHYTNPVKVDIPLEEGESLKELRFGPTMASVVVTNENPSINDQLYIWGSNNVYNNLGVQMNFYYEPTKVSKDNWTGFDENNRHDINMYKGHNYTIENVVIGRDNSTIFLENEIGQTFIFISGMLMTSNFDKMDSSWLDVSYFFSSGYDGANQIVKMDGTNLSGVYGYPSEGIIVKNEQNYNDYYTFGQQHYNNLQTEGGTRNNLQVTPWKTEFLDLSYHNAQVSDFSISENNSIVILDQLVTDPTYQAGTQEIAMLGLNNYGQINIPDAPYGGTSNVDGYYELTQNYFPKITRFAVDTTYLQTEKRLLFSVTLTYYKYWPLADKDWVEVTCLYDDGEATNNSISLNTNYRDGWVHESEAKWNYEIVNLQPGYYHDFKIDFGITGLPEGDVNTNNLNFVVY